MALGSRIAQRLAELGKSQAWLALESGVDEGTISAIITRDSQKSSFAMRIARALRCAPEWLLTGEGPIEAPPDDGIRFSRAGGSSPAHNVEQDLAHYGSRLPLISWVSAGTRAEANDPYILGTGEEWIEFQSPSTKHSYALRVKGDSMVRPDGTGFPDGCIIAVDAHRRAKSGDYIVMRFNHTDEATFKQYIVDGPMRLLKPLNPAYPTLQIPPDAQLCGVVFEKLMREKF